MFQSNSTILHRVCPQHIACEDHVTLWDMAKLIAEAVHGDALRAQMDFTREAQMPQHDVGPIRSVHRGRVEGSASPRQFAYSPRNNSVTTPLSHPLLALPSQYREGSPDAGAARL